MSCTASDILRRIRTDEELMLAVRAGDLAAFEHLVVRHQSSAWNAAYRISDAHQIEAERPRSGASRHDCHI